MIITPQIYNSKCLRNKIGHPWLSANHETLRHLAPSHLRRIQLRVVQRISVHDISVGNRYIWRFSRPRTQSRMTWYNSVLLLLLLTASLEASYGEDECQYNTDCKNGTHACCHRRSQPSVCRETCVDESCSIDWDCGTDLNMICCQDDICRSSWNMCPADKYRPGWITVVVVLSVLCAVFGIGGTIFCIYLRNRHRSRLSNGLLVEEPVAASTYGTYRWLSIEANRSVLVA